jgi:ribosomal protein S27AE
VKDRPDADDAAVPSEDVPVPETPSGCDRCGGDVIVGTLALPMLGRARFAYSLRGRSVETELDSRMCVRCGAIMLTATDPERIRRAAAASRRADAYDR